MSKFYFVIAAMLANTLAAATMTRSVPPSDAPQQDRSIDGLWEGSLSVAGATLQISVSFATNSDGLGATIDIPQQGATGIALANVSYVPPKVHFELTGGAGLAVFDGEQRGDSISGSFTQAGFEGSFAIARSEVSDKNAEAEEPVPYLVEEVTFRNGDVTLAGTLTLPRAGAPHGAVVMITGSGPQNRDEELFGFRPFRVIADHLTRNGIAVLRYDDRGVGGSTGSVNESTTEDFAYDALAAIDHLQERTDIHARAIGLIGHSEGGVVAPLAASKSDDVAFMVLLAGTAVTGEEILYAQGELILRANGASEDEIQAQRSFQQRLFAAMRTGEGWPELEADFRARLVAQLDSMPPAQREAIQDVDAFLDAQVEAQLYSARTPWFEFFLDYDPIPALQQANVPTLALFGELDLQVPPAVNRLAMEEAFRAGGNPDYTIEVLPRANHLFITANTGSPNEYPTLEKVFVPEFLPLLTDWLRARVDAAAR